MTLPCVRTPRRTSFDRFSLLSRCQCAANSMLATKLGQFPSKVERLSSFSRRFPNLEVEYAESRRPTQWENRSKTAYGPRIGDPRATLGIEPPQTSNHLAKENHT